MKTELEILREKYFEYITEYNWYKIGQKILIDNTSVVPEESIAKLAELQIKLGLHKQKILYQMGDTFVNAEEKKAYISSIKTFVLDEIKKWEQREPQGESYDWFPYVMRDWQPNWLYELKEKIEEIENITNLDVSIKNDPLSFIDPLFLQLFLQAEKKALNGKNQFFSKIRCAAFCELLWEKRYFSESKNRILSCNNFSKNRYGTDISNSLQKTKEDERNKHKNYSVGKMPPLKNCF